MQNLAISNITSTRETPTEEANEKSISTEVMALIGRLFTFNFGCNLDPVKEFRPRSFLFILLTVLQSFDLKNESPINF